MHATSRRSGFAATVRYTDAGGQPRPITSATVKRSPGAVVSEPGCDAGITPDIAGDLDLVISTQGGERPTFTANCIAAGIATPLGLLVSGDAITRGWPANEARRTLVDFKAFGPGSTTESYVASNGGGRPGYPLADSDVNTVARLSANALAERRYDREPVRAVALRHQRALKRLSHSSRRGSSA
jgi:hypothetical protein